MNMSSTLDRSSQVEKLCKSLRIALLFLTIVFLVEKSIASWLFLSQDSRTLSQLGFGFGGYIDSLINSGIYRTCFEGMCDYSTRMPLVPVLFAAISRLSDSTLFAALAKNTAISLVFIVTLQTYYWSARRDRLAFLVAATATMLIMTVSAPVVKHCSAVDYEEGIITELLVLWILGFLLLVRSVLSQGSKRNGIYITASTVVLIATLIYLSKSSMILILVLTYTLVIIFLLFARASSSQTAILCTSLAFSIFFVGLWGMHNLSHIGKFSVSSTWNGENLYRGSNSVSLAIYPDLSLDRVMDSRSFILRDGSQLNVAQPAKGRQSFESESEWNTYYAKLSKEWHLRNPRQSLLFTQKKLNNFFLSIEKSPFSVHDYKSPSLPIETIESFVVNAWLVFGRIFQLILIVLTIAVIRRNSTKKKLFIFIIYAALCAYALPYIAVFNYERHITPFLLMVIASTTFVAFVFFAESSKMPYAHRFSVGGRYGNRDDP